MSAFEAVFTTFMAELFALDPVFATETGDHTHDPAIQPGDLPGGFGPTPGFRFRDHLEAVLAHGAPPTSLLRRILLR